MTLHGQSSLNTAGDKDSKYSLHFPIFSRLLEENYKIINYGKPPVFILVGIMTWHCIKCFDINLLNSHSANDVEYILISTSLVENVKHGEFM